MSIKEDIIKAKKRHGVLLKDLLSKEKMILDSTYLKVEKRPDEELVFILNRISILENFLKNMGREGIFYNKIPVCIKDNTVMGILKKNLEKQK